MISISFSSPISGSKYIPRNEKEASTLGHRIQDFHLDGINLEIVPFFEFSLPLGPFLSVQRYQMCSVIFSERVPLDETHWEGSGTGWSEREAR